MIVCLLAAAMTASLASAQSTQSAQATRATAATQPTGGGEFDVSFPERSPLSSFDMQHGRYGVERNKANFYELDAERFRVMVPGEFDAAGGGAGWGVIIWCDAGKGGRVPHDLEALLAKKKLIAACAYDAGNDRGVGARIGLALDAVHNLRQQHGGLDVHRTYVAGTSGGAKVAEMAAMAFPEVFDGAISCAGANWYKDMPVPDKPNTAWPRAFAKPPTKTFADARDHVGFILITGNRDGNYVPMKTMYEKGFQGDGFKHVSFYDVPGLGHQTAPAEFLEKAIDELDALPKDREKKLPAAKPVPKPASRPATRVVNKRPR